MLVGTFVSKMSFRSLNLHRKVPGKTRNPPQNQINMLFPGKLVKEKKRTEGSVFMRGPWGGPPRTAVRLSGGLPRTAVHEEDRRGQRVCPSGGPGRHRKLKSNVVVVFVSCSVWLRLSPPPHHSSLWPSTLAPPPPPLGGGGEGLHQSA